MQTTDETPLSVLARVARRAKLLREAEDNNRKHRSRYSLSHLIAAEKDLDSALRDAEPVLEAQDQHNETEAKIKADRNSFERGFSVAVSMMLRGNDAKECLRAAGLMDRAHIDALGLDGFDLEPLRRFLECES